MSGDGTGKGFLSKKKKSDEEDDGLLVKPLPPVVEISTGCWGERRLAFSGSFGGSVVAGDLGTSNKGLGTTLQVLHGILQSGNTEGLVPDLGLLRRLRCVPCPSSRSRTLPPSFLCRT